MGKECCSRLSRSLWGGMKIHALLKTPAWEASTFYSISMDWSESEGSYCCGQNTITLHRAVIKRQGQGFPLAIMNMVPATFTEKLKKNRSKRNPRLFDSPPTCCMYTAT